MGSVAIAIYILITGRNGFPPMGTALKVVVIDIGTSVNDINVNTLATMSLVDVFIVGTKVQTLLVRDTGKTPRSRVFSYGIRESIDLGIFLDIGNIRVITDLLHNRFVKSTRVTEKASRDVICVLETG
jgi:hypothetical protein